MVSLEKYLNNDIVTIQSSRDVSSLSFPSLTFCTKHENMVEDPENTFEAVNHKDISFQDVVPYVGAKYYLGKYEKMWENIHPLSFATF